jgi:L-fuconolactonase
VDAHQHFWDIESGAYAWPTPADGAIYRTFRPDDLAPELGPAGIDRTVLVQTVDTLADTDSMLHAAHDYAFIAGVVGWVPLADVAAAERALDERAGRALRGIRHLIHQEPDPDWLVRPEHQAGLALLAERGLVFDVVAVFPRHLGLVPAVADRHPALTLVVDHLAKPPIRARERDGWDAWVRDLRSAASRPNVHAKISGLDTAAGPDWSVAELAPAVDVALEAFGPDRLLFGSDWPVCVSVSTYRGVVAAADELLTALTVDERAAIMGGTATRVYALEA